MVASTTISETTISSSMRVKPRSPIFSGRSRRLLATCLPILVLRAVERRPVARGEYVVHVLPAPRAGVRPVLVRAHPPLLRACDGIERDAAQELQLPIRRVTRRAHAFDEHLERRWIPFVPGLQLGSGNHPLIRRIFVMVDGRAHLAQRAMQFDFARTLHRDARQRHDRGREDPDQGRDDEQLDERESTIRRSPQGHHRTVIVTGLDCTGTTPPAGPAPVPFTVSVAAPGATASKRTAASSPVPDAPTASPPRVTVKSIRPAAASTCWVKLAFAPPWRMKLPSCTDRTRSW